MVPNGAVPSASQRRPASGRPTTPWHNRTADGIGVWWSSRRAHERASGTTRPRVVWQSHTEINRLPRVSCSTEQIGNLAFRFELTRRYAAA
jgi:hypothetical protein